MLKGENYIRVLLAEMQAKQKHGEDTLSFGEQDTDELTALIGEIDRIKQENEQLHILVDGITGDVAENMAQIFARRRTVATFKGVRA